MTTNNEVKRHVNELFSLLVRTTVVDGYDELFDSQASVRLIRLLVLSVGFYTRMPFPKFLSS